MLQDAARVASEDEEIRQNRLKRRKPLVAQLEAAVRETADAETVRCLVKAQAQGQWSGPVVRVKGQGQGQGQG